MPIRTHRKDMNDFSQWLTIQRDHFRTGSYSLDDIARLARACGFSENVIKEWEFQQILKGGA